MNPLAAAASVAGTPTDEPIKCVVWDLDNTLWDGVLLEDAAVSLRPRVVDAIRALDARGIVNSIASRNENELALETLRRFGVAEWFVCPQIGWWPKSDAIGRIAAGLRLSVSALAFVDDQDLERAEVQFTHPQVRCFAETDLDALLSAPACNPAIITDEARRRRQMYQAEERRVVVEASFVGTPEEFLASLHMRLHLAVACAADLPRLQELVVRTHQLNSTGTVYSAEELQRLLLSPSHRVVVAELDDRFGGYGKIALLLLERAPQVWRLRLLLVSCRVMNRGIGTLLLKYLMRCARLAGVPLLADFVHTASNRVMYVTYKLAGFRELKSDEAGTVLVDSGEVDAQTPSHVAIVVDSDVF